ncbi:MAG: class I SAM-dependent methyltransferase [bacterium]|nr:class I SAM-dependent methyltransferase [bacterium]
MLKGGTGGHDFHGRPEPFSTYTTPEFWNDPHISAQMLRHHLDPDSPAASRTHAFIDRSARWIAQELDLGPGSRVLDLGCGPGLYALRLARRGIHVTGVDVSQRSLEHARTAATSEDLPIHLIRGSYLDTDLGTGHHAALLIFEEYSALSPSQRALLLGRVREALRPGGTFLSDVTAAPRFDDDATPFRRESPNLGDGFWAEPPYHGIHERFTYREPRLILDRYRIERDGRTREYWNWMHCLTPDQVEHELARAGFAVGGLYGDVAGAPYDPTSHTFAITAHAGADTRVIP